MSAINLFITNETVRRLEIADNAFADLASIYYNTGIQFYENGIWQVARKYLETCTAIYNEEELETKQAADAEFKLGKLQLKLAEQASEEESKILREKALSSFTASANRYSLSGDEVGYMKAMCQVGEMHAPYQNKTDSTEAFLNACEVALELEFELCDPIPFEGASKGFDTLVNQVEKSGASMQTHPELLSLGLRVAFCAWKFAGVEKALAYLDTLIRHANNLLDAYVLRGQILLKERKFEEADEAFCRALTCNPLHYDAILGRIEVMFERAKTVEAYRLVLAEIEYATKLKPISSDVEVEYFRYCTALKDLTFRANDLIK